MKLSRMIAAVLIAAGLLQADPATPPKTTRPASSAQKAKRRYKNSGASTPSKPAPKVSAATRQEASEGVQEKVTSGAEIPVENPAALIPFFEQLYRQQRGETAGPLHVLQYGDSHTAADEWTGDLRERFQQKFGDGGSGYLYAGRPYNGYRNFSAKTGSTRGWKPEGVVGRPGDGALGLGGISMTASKPHESIYVTTEGQTFELFYMRQPGGGAFEIYDNGEPVEQISTDGEAAPAYYRYETDAGAHRLEIETRDHAPVKVFGWTADKATGITYEPLGINGVSASVILNWDEAVLDSNLSRRNPGLIVLAYGTNESGHKDWTIEKYRAMYERILVRLRNAAPTATILVVGPPDREIRAQKNWVILDHVDTIVEAQRQAAVAQGCAFWDLRAKMGGRGSMRQWVLAGMAQRDYVHFTAPGYRMIGDAVFRDLMSQYDLFLRVRDVVAAAAPPVLPLAPSAAPR